MIAAEFTAALPEPQIILGLRLWPLSLGRYRLLKRFESPFVDESPREISVQELTNELFFALLICGLPVSEFKSYLMQPKLLAKQAKRFGKIAGKHTKQKGFSILPCFEQFKIYCAEATAMPWHPLSNSRTNEAESISHWSHSMEICLRSNAGWTAEEIEEEPMAKAMTDFFKYMESQGSVRLISHEDYSAMEAHGEANAKAFEEYLATLN